MKPIILGAGLAGLTTALSLAPLPVILVSSRELGESCASAWAQGGIAAAIGADDSAAFHTQDTLAVGAGINDTNIVRQTIQDGASIIENFVSSGVNFDRDTQGKLLLGLEAAHQKRRIVHAADATGKAVTKALIALARRTPSIEIIENATAKALLTNNGITGVVLQQGDAEVTLSTNTVVLASGGATALWRDTTNPHENWGSGLILAARAGATLGDMEFIQFHPTAIDLGRSPMPLASEALRGEGATLVDEKGHRFIDELQPRDIVARAIWQKIAEGHRVFLDASQTLGDRFAVRFPNIYAVCIDAHINPATALIPVRPAAHYHMGGVLTDAHGRTDVAGLWACGEVACTGLHGANRLASNSLLEAASFGKRIAEDIKGQTLIQRMPVTDGTYVPAQETQPDMRNKIRATLSDSVGLIRDRTGLKQALDFLAPFAQTSDMALVGTIIAHAALQREESRGAHYRSDFPQTAPIGHRSVFRLSDMESL